MTLGRTAREEAHADALTPYAQDGVVLAVIPRIITRTPALLILCCACGATSATHVAAAGGATVFTAIDAYSAVLTETESPVGAPSFPVTDLQVLVSSSPGACARVAAKSNSANSMDVVIRVRHGTPDAISAGTYSVGAGVVVQGDPTPTASALIAATDGSCHVTAPAGVAITGTVTLSQITNEQVSGSIHVTFADGTKVLGAFVAPNCAAADALPTSTGPWACVQQQ